MSLSPDSSSSKQAMLVPEKEEEEEEEQLWSSLDARTQPLRSLRKKSLFPPAVENPFVMGRHFSEARWLCMALGGLILLPLRCILLILVILVSWPLAIVATAYYPPKLTHPLRSWRLRLIRPLLHVLGTFFFFIMGFLVKVKGVRAGPREAPIFVAAPHSTFFDSIAWIVIGLQSVVSRQETATCPFIGRMLLTGQPVLVSRGDPDSRKSTVNEIKIRATSEEDWPQILIFPEGTCTNRTCLITFKPGAFLPGVPVQPVLLRYPNKVDTVTWTWEGYTAIQLLLLTLVQPFTNMELEFLPVYIPDDEEREDPVLYASRVRNVMANALQVPVTDHTFEDCKLMISAGKLDLPVEAGLVEFTKISNKLNLNWDAVRKHLDEFAEIAASSKGGRIRIEEFAKYLRLPITDTLKQLFELFDRNHDDTIDFREYVIGLYVLCNPANTEDLIHMAFKLFDIDEDGYITEKEFATILQASLGVRNLEVSNLFQDIAKENSNHISYSEFESFAMRSPEYTRLFTTYLELQKSDLFSLPEGTNFKGLNSYNKVNLENVDGFSDKKDN